MLRTLQLRGTLRGAGARGAPSRELYKTLPTTTLWQVSESVDNFQVRDPWRTPLVHKEQWKPQ